MWQIRVRTQSKTNCYFKKSIKFHLQYVPILNLLYYSTTTVAPSHKLHFSNPLAMFLTQMIGKRLSVLKNPNEKHAGVSTASTLSELSGLRWCRSLSNNMKTTSTERDGYSFTVNILLCQLQFSCHFVLPWQSVSTIVMRPCR